MTDARLLVVDDKRDLARGVGLVLSPLSSDIGVCHSAEDALASLEERPAAVILSDIRMPGLDGLALLERVRARWPATRVILFTAYATVESAVEAMKLGAFDYLTKPFNNDELLLVTQRALQAAADEAELHRLRAVVSAREGLHGLFTVDPRMRPVLETVRKVAPSNASVLICGESGTGKELVARALHAESGRARARFLAFNAAALPETLAEAELFGARKGAYTGADRDRKGLFAEASGGTLLIDELATMSAALQGKLLRALQERVVVPLGQTAPVPVDVRIVAATNIDPRKLLRDGTLRQDLYYRLAVVRLVIPPLRERAEDIALLAQRFLDRMAVPGMEPRRLSSRALRLLYAHDWPGNVRELQNVMERAALLAAGPEIGPADIVLDRLDDAFDATEVDGDLEAAGLDYETAKRGAVERFQRRYVERLLAETGGNISAAARQAGLTRAALHRILNRLGIGGDDTADEA
jgi:DNA-binding NtrC family response regulator